MTKEVRRILLVKKKVLRFLQQKNKQIFERKQCVDFSEEQEYVNFMTKEVSKIL
jgi:hypothetical protein